VEATGIVVSVAEIPALSVVVETGVVTLVTRTEPTIPHTLVPFEWAAAAVPLIPRVTPVKLVAVVPVYDICSLSIRRVPDDGKPDVVATGIVVSPATIPLLKVVDVPHTEEPLECAVAVVPLIPRVTPVKLVAVVPVYDICSLSIRITPDPGKPEVEPTGIVVSLAPIPPMYGFCTSIVTVTFWPLVTDRGSTERDTARGLMTTVFEVPVFDVALAAVAPADHETVPAASARYVYVIVPCAPAFSVKGEGLYVGPPVCVTAAPPPRLAVGGLGEAVMLALLAVERFSTCMTSVIVWPTPTASGVATSVTASERRAQEGAAPFWFVHRPALSRERTRVLESVASAALLGRFAYDVPWSTTVKESDAPGAIRAAALLARNSTYDSAPAAGLEIAATRQFVGAVVPRAMKYCVRVK
jgi:hypothetical protein